MLHSFIFFLQQRKWLNLFLVFVYFAFIMAMHHPMVLLSIWVEKNLSIEIYNLVVAGIFLLLLTILLFYVSKQFLKNKEHRNLQLFYLLTTITLIIIHSRFMFDSNIEVIHSFEFTFLAFLIFPLSKRFGAAVLFTLPFMLFDEWYQYIILYPQWNDYFDLNDVLMDIYGCGLTMVVLMICGVKGDENIKPLWKRPEFITLFCFVIVIILLVKTHFIAPFFIDKAANTFLVMNRNEFTESFWRHHPTHHIWYHVMKPVEGFIAITALLLFYFGLDSFRKS